MTKKNSENLSFEDALSELEKIIQQLESGEADNQPGSILPHLNFKPLLGDPIHALSLSGGY